MDPISAIGLASAILTLVDFAQKVVTGADELYQKASTEENAHIETIANDLDDAATDLVTLPGNTKHEKALNRLAEKCRDVAQELQQLLKRLTVSGKRTPWKVMKVAIRNVQKESDVLKLLARLDKYRGEVLLRLNLILKCVSSEKQALQFGMSTNVQDSDQQCSIKVQLDRIEAEGLSFSNESANQLKTLREDILRSVTQLVERTGDKEAHVDLAKPPIERDMDVQEFLSALSTMMVNVPKENAILQSIFFSTMKLRETSMDSAEAGTFEWMFEEEQELAGSSESSSSSSLDDTSLDTWSSHSKDNREDFDESEGNIMDRRPDNVDSRSQSPESAENTAKRTLKRTYSQIRNHEIREEESRKRAVARDNFRTWLRSGEGIFHISGKAGSGKSTLMKYICSQAQTREDLRAWAGETKTLVLSRFFFWKSSNDNMQMTLPGLHRSILYETLKCCPDLIPQVFPRQWKMLGNGVPHVQEDLITDIDAQSAFEDLVSNGSFPKHRFCFFVDGLDEYDGSLPQQLKLARDMQRWTSGTDVKICASSRPYIEFDKLAASSDQIIHLHDLTRHDIYLFSCKMIEDNLGKDVLMHHTHMVAKVVDKSQGVFLWARLVMISLLEGMIRHDKEELLEHKLDVMPSDIGGLYARILESLSPDDRKRAELFLLMTAHRPDWPPLSSVMYAFVDELNDPKFPPCDGKRPPTWRSYEETAQDVRLQLKSLTKGLLETTPMLSEFDLRPLEAIEQVQFFHRTLRDFILERFRLEFKTDRLPWVTKNETYYRLFLAELILSDLPSQIGAVRDHYGDMSLPFSEEVPTALLEGFRCSLKSMPLGSMSKQPGPSLCRRLRHVMDDPEGLSFFSLAASCGQTDYVLEQITNMPDLLRGGTTHHILLSAAMGNEGHLVRKLLEKGACPMDRIECFETRDNLSRSEGGSSRSVPLLLLVIMHLAAYFSRYGAQTEIDYDRWEILEMLLKDQPIDGVNLSLLWNKKTEKAATHYMTLNRFIEDSHPPNADRLQALLKRNKKKSFVVNTRRFLSEPALLFKQGQSYRDKHKSRRTYIQLAHIDADESWSLWGATLGDLEVERILLFR